MWVWFVLGLVFGMFWITALCKSAQEGDRILEERNARRLRTESRRRTKEIDRQLSHRRWD